MKLVWFFTFTEIPGHRPGEARGGSELARPAPRIEMKNSDLAVPPNYNPSTS